MFDTPSLECNAEPLSFSFLSCWNFHMFRKGLKQGDRDFWGQSQQLKGGVATQLGDSVCALYYTIDWFPELCFSVKCCKQQK